MWETVHVFIPQPCSSAHRRAQEGHDEGLPHLMVHSMVAMSPNSNTVHVTWYERMRVVRSANGVEGFMRKAIVELLLPTC